MDDVYIVFGYTSGTVSYAKELTSVSICYSQGNDFNTLKSRLLCTTVHARHLCFVQVPLFKEK